MKNANGIRWLYSQLPDLIDRGVIDTSTASKLKDHYGEVKYESKLPSMVTIFASIGAACIGLGIILLFAHNWDMIPRWLRAVLAFIPTMLTGLLVVWTLTKNKKSVALRESVAVGNMLSVGAMISLISQTYQIQGDISSFLLTWMLVCVPLVYLLDVTLPSVLYLAGITAWAGVAQMRFGNALLFFPLSLTIFPYWYSTLKRKQNTAQWLAAVACICYTIVIGIFLENAIPGAWIIVYCSFCAAMYLTGSYIWSRSELLWPVPLKRLGILGVVVMSYILTFNDTWDKLGYAVGKTLDDYLQIDAVADYIVCVLCLLTTCYLLIRMIQKRNYFETIFGSLPLVAIFGLITIASGASAYLPAWIFSAYVLVIGITTIASGIKNARLGTTNAGIFLVALLLFIRFMEEDVPIITRAVVFIVIGIMFLLTNVRLARRLQGGNRES